MLIHKNSLVNASPRAVEAVSQYFKKLAKEHSLAYHDLVLSSAHLRDVMKIVSLSAASGSEVSRAGTQMAIDALGSVNDHVHALSETVVGKELDAFDVAVHLWEIERIAIEITAEDTNTNPRDYLNIDRPEREDLSDPGHADPAAVRTVH